MYVSRHAAKRVVARAPSLAHTVTCVTEMDPLLNICSARVYLSGASHGVAIPSGTDKLEIYAFDKWARKD